MPALCLFNWGVVVVCVCVCVGGGGGGGAILNSFSLVVRDD